MVDVQGFAGRLVFLQQPTCLDYELYSESKHIRFKTLLQPIQHRFDTA